MIAQIVNQRSVFLTVVKMDHVLCVENI